jgi:hypothetical protein
MSRILRNLLHIFLCCGGNSIHSLPKEEKVYFCTRDRIVMNYNSLIRSEPNSNQPSLCLDFVSLLNYEELLINFVNQIYSFNFPVLHLTAVYKLEWNPCWLKVSIIDLSNLIQLQNFSYE